MTGTVKGYEVKKNRNSDQGVLMLQVAISSEDDIQSVEYMTHTGDNSIPVIGSVVTILQAGSSWKIAIASKDTSDFDDTLKEGDRYLYSKDKASYIKILSDGTIQINGDVDNAVRYSALETAYNTLKTDLNNLISTFNAHVHPFVGVGPGNPGTTSTSATPGTPSTGDISGAKIDEVFTA